MSCAGCRLARAETMCAVKMILGKQLFIPALCTRWKKERLPPPLRQCCPPPSPVCMCTMLDACVRMRQKITLALQWGAITYACAHMRRFSRRRSRAENNQHLGCADHALVTRARETCPCRLADKRCNELLAFVLTRCANRDTKSTEQPRRR
jgi:hypothetical protein